MSIEQSEKEIASAVDVAQKVKEGLVDKRKPPSYNSFSGVWKVGLYPEEEEKLRQKLGSEIIKSLQEGPEIHEKKMRKKIKEKNLNVKIVDPGAGGPKAFLLAEYNGKCQVCSTQLLLSNGGKYFEIFRIHKHRGEAWWADRPFNILCLCPNCHALAKHGGGLNLENIYYEARRLLRSETFAVEVEEHGGDYYVVPVMINGKEQKLVMSAAHINHFAALFEEAERVDY